MNKYYLKMNSDKTEIMILHPRSLSHNVISGMLYNSKCMRFTKECKFLGVYLYPCLTSDSPVNYIISVCQLKLKGIRRIRHLMTCKDAETFIKAVIFSKLNYCNILYLNITAQNLNKLQKLQNSAVRLIFNLQARESIAQKFIDLELLRVDQSIVFTCLVYVHRFFQNKVPE